MDGKRDYFIYKLQYFLHAYVHIGIDYIGSINQINANENISWNLYETKFPERRMLNNFEMICSTRLSPNENALHFMVHTEQLVLSQQGLQKRQEIPANVDRRQTNTHVNDYIKITFRKIF